MIGRIAIRSALVLFVGASALAAVPRDASAVARWTADGMICAPWTDRPHQTFFVHATGMKIYTHTSGTMRAICPILTGPNFVELHDSAPNTFSNVHLAFHMDSHNNLPKPVTTSLYLHDNFSDNYCTCDSVVADQNDGFFSRTLHWDAIGNNCQGCNTEWQLAVQVQLVGGQGQFQISDSLEIKRVRVHDDT
jgi:hypothetical protein